MPALFDIWKSRIDAAQDESARRALLAEIGAWRVDRLVDIPAQREASFSLSSLYGLLGEKEMATQEAQQLVSLCRMPPEVRREEMRFVLRHADVVAGKPPRPERAERGERGDRAKVDVWAEAIAAAEAARWEDARALIRGRKGPRPTLFRVWSHLAEALASEGEAREAALQTLLGELRSRAFGASGRNEGAPDASESKLALLLGRSVPRRREPLLKMLDEHIVAHPETADAIAAAALDEHIANEGAKSTAPWLITFVARALATTDGSAIRGSLREHSKHGAYAVTAYDEPGFAQAVELASRATKAGWRLTGVRRGVLRRGEPADRRLWTVRMARGGGDVMVVLAPEAGDPYTDDVAAQLARRVGELSRRLVVSGPGSANAGFRAACLALGAFVIDGDDPDDIVATLETLRPAPAPAPSAVAPGAAAGGRGDKPAVSSRAPSPVHELRALFESAEEAAVEAYAGLAAGLRRMVKGFSAIRDPLALMEPAAADARLAPFLEAMHQVAPPFVGFGEGRSMAIRTAAAHRGGLVEGVLTGEGTADRYAGPGIATVLDVVEALAGEGWVLDRVTLGVTRRESRDKAALEALGESLGGLWRLELDRGDERVHILVLSGATTEGLAAAPLLLVGGPPTIVVVVDASIDGLGVAGLTWSGDPAELRAAAEAHKAARPARPERRPSRDERRAAAPVAPAPAEAEAAPAEAAAPVEAAPVEAAPVEAAPVEAAAAPVEAAAAPVEAASVEAAPAEAPQDTWSKDEVFEAPPADDQTEEV